MNKDIKNKKNLHTHEQKSKWIAFVLVACALGIGLYLRLGGVLSNSFAFTYDVGRDLLQVHEMVTKLDIPLIGQTSGLGGLYYGPWWYYILTPPFLLSGGNPQGIALFMVVLGLASIITGYFLGKRVEGVSLGIIIAGFLSFSPVLISSSVQIWNPNTAPLFVLLLFLCFFSNVRSKIKTFLLFTFCGVLLGLILDSEIVFGVLFAAGLAVSYLILWKNEVFSRKTAYIALGFLFTLLPRLLFEIRHGFVMTKSLTNVSDEQSVLNIKDFFLVFPERLHVFLTLFSEVFGVNIPVTILMCICVLAVWLWAGRRSEISIRKLFYTNVIIIFVFLVGSSFFARAIWGHYLVALPVLYIIVFSVALLLIMRKNQILGILLCVVFLTLTIRPQDVISNLYNPNWEGNAAVYRNQVAVIDYIYKDADGKSFNYTAYTPSVHDYPYRYLFLWYGKNKYGYTPAGNAQDTLYMILEPDPGYEGRLTDWLKIREGDGKIVNDNVIKGGIRVQKRVR